MSNVVVTFTVATAVHAEELREDLLRCLHAEFGNRPAPWVPGAVLANILNALVEVSPPDAAV